MSETSKGVAPGDNLAWSNIRRHETIDGLFEANIVLVLPVQETNEYEPEITMDDQVYGNPKHLQLWVSSGDDTQDINRYTQFASRGRVLNAMINTASNLGYRASGPDNPISEVIREQLEEIGQPELYPLIYYSMNATAISFTENPSREQIRSMYYPDPSMKEQTRGLIDEAWVATNALKCMLRADKNILQNLTCFGDISKNGIVYDYKVSRKKLEDNERTLLKTLANPLLSRFVMLNPGLSEVISYKPAQDSGISEKHVAALSRKDAYTVIDGIRLERAEFESRQVNITRGQQNLEDLHAAEKQAAE
jgi:hypothetical protein